MFANLDQKLNLWSRALNAQGNSGTPLDRLTSNAAEGADVHISPDGKKMVFVTVRFGNADMWLQDLETKHETILVATPGPEIPRKFTADGSAVIYGTRENSKNVGYRISIGGRGTPVKLCEDCCSYDVSSDDKTMVSCVAPGPRARQSYWISLAVERAT